MNYYDTSLREMPGPKRTFEGPSNTGDILPSHYGRIRLDLDTSPVGLEKLLTPISSQKVRLYIVGGALYSAAAFEGFLSLLQSGAQIYEVLNKGHTTASAESYLLSQTLTIAGLLGGKYLAEDAIRKARRTRSR